jgi:threonine/homoserine/homoserine lactone efflux protein
LLCIRRSMAEGQRVGLVTGLGAATADAGYGCVAAFGLTGVSSFLVGHQFWLSLIGGLFLCYRFQSRLGHGWMRFINRSSGSVLFAFGIYSLSTFWFR